MRQGWKWHRRVARPMFLPVASSGGTEQAGYPAKQGHAQRSKTDSPIRRPNNYLMAFNILSQRNP
jgi:hypothetical protein